ncbi:MAG: hypothetical protein LBK75_00885 [Oscillospiraceae bacterium]|nr:hypothetical protein [Oscillospiraceae bacterium]
MFSVTVMERIGKRSDTNMWRDAAPATALIPADRKRVPRNRSGRTLRTIGHTVEELV